MPYIAHEDEPDEIAYQLYQEHMHQLEQEQYDLECWLDSLEQNGEDCSFLDFVAAGGNQ